MNFIEKLAEDAQGIVNALKTNRFKGIKTLLTDLYPDNAHFIYELLQNAEDAQATEVMFILTSEELEFSHNGKRLFTEDDIESITSIGHSTKKDDINQIGKFGVGFKAVFSYTETPKIYSGQYAFEIHDLVCPREITQTLKPSENTTIFSFPFNHPEKSRQKAFQEIKETLLKLPDNTILFLQNVKQINWEIVEDNKSGFIKRSQLDKSDFFEIEKMIDESEKTHWLRFSKEIAIESGKQSFIAIAFRLNKLKDSKEFRIDPKITKGDVSIFFPAEKENSGLKFFIHAPFASTVARDSIQNRPENNDLRDFLVNLLVESLTKIKEYKLLDRDFLSVMPNQEDILSDFYKPFRANIINAFQTQEFTPTWRNSFAPSKKLLQANNEIKNVINNDSILTYVIKNEETDEEYDWVTNAQRGSRAYRFLENLEIREVTLTEILDRVAKTFKDGDVANNILSSLSDEWLQSFYALLLKGKEEAGEHFKVKQYEWQQPLVRIRDAKLIRLQNKTHVQSKNVYFQTEFTKKIKDLKLVKIEVYESGDNKNQQEKARLFLETIGIEEFQEKNEIERILKNHYTRESFNITEEQNLKHIDIFIDFLHRNQYQTFIFKDFCFLRIEDSKKEKYTTPFQTYIDVPFEKTDVSVFEIFHNKRPLWNGYNTKISNKGKFLWFLKAIGVISKFEVKINEIKTWANPLRGELLSKFSNTRETSTATNTDFQITDLQKFLSAKHYEISKMIWDIISKANKRVITARYRPNQSYRSAEVPSQLIQTLKEYAWIPDKNNVFRKPYEMSQETLPDDFPYNNENGWLDAIEFDTAIQKQIESEKKENDKNKNLAIQLGFESLEEVEKYKKNKDAFKKFLEKEELKKRQISKTPSQRNWNLTDFSFDDFTDKKTGFDDRNRSVKLKERSVVEEYPSTKIDSRDFLKSQYTNEWQQLVCQICQEEMPFQIYNGEYYFESVKIVEDTTLDNISNYLCCCPNCSAMYRFANKYKENMKSLILEIQKNEDENILLNLELAHNECEINFSEKHFDELVNFIQRQT